MVDLGHLRVRINLWVNVQKVKESSGNGNDGVQLQGQSEEQRLRVFSAAGLRTIDFPEQTIFTPLIFSADRAVFSCWLEVALFLLDSFLDSCYFLSLVCTAPTMTANY